MRNCIILGSGRSGTSMLAGTLANSGYFMGDSLHPPKPGNPKGFFEGPQINSINEHLIENIGDPDLQLKAGQRWLSRLPLDIKMPDIAPQVQHAIKYMTARQPYCFKDPRFNYTLPAWRPFLIDTVFLCIFREPAITASSVLKECKNAKYLQNIDMTMEWALQLWHLMYAHIYTLHRHSGDWLFLHYNQVLEGEGLDRIESLLDITVDRSFPDPTIGSKYSALSVPTGATQLYEQLCSLAAYRKP